MNGASGGNLQNVLSVSTAANNRYLLHFNSLNSLTQWTAGIRLAIFEHSTLQEAYTGSLIAGKGKYLNNIKAIMDRSKFIHDDWARVRFGAGTPWRRCWCVISPPDEKEYQKAQKTLKKGSSYSRPQVPKGDIKFYDTRKVTKKTKPIATIKDAFAAYAIYPQSKPLIDQSTLVKLEGIITVHGQQDTTTEGFVFVMPEVHAAVSGFEMMLRWLFPVYDTFALYGRPNRLIADTLDQRGLMFAMPSSRRYGYLDILDVSALIHTSGSQDWSERQWRKELKKLTSTRMMNQMDDSPRNSRQIGQRRNTTSRSSLPPGRHGVVTFNEQGIHSSPGSRSGSPTQTQTPSAFAPPKRTDSAPPGAMMGSPHKRSVSEALGGYRRYPSRLSHEQGREEDDEPPVPPRHGGVLGAAQKSESQLDVSSYEQTAKEANSQHLVPPEPVVSPPAMQHSANSRPPNQPFAAPELRRAHSNVDAATLYQMQAAAHPTEDDDGSDPPHSRDGSALPYRNQSLGPPPDHTQQFVDAPEYGNGWSRDQKQRLSTIPGSPYAAHGHGGEYFDPSQQAQMAPMDGVVGKGSDGRPELKQSRSSGSVLRKPVPKHQQSHDSAEAEQNSSRREQASQVRAMDPAEPGSPVLAAGDYYDAVIDQDALERILNEGDRASSLATSATPDYASVESEHEVKQKKPKEWVRPGKLKTVGDPDMPTIESKHDTWNKDLAEQTAEMPTINFGPTYTYKPNSRPGTSGTMTPGDMERRSRSRSADRLRQSSGSRLSGYFATPSPGESNRQSYFGGRATPTGIEGDSPGNRQSMVWTPQGNSPGTPGTAHQKRQTLTPEEWVLHRAQMASQPRRGSPIQNFPHQRHVSSNNAQQLRKSLSRTPPPFTRTPSGDWTQQAQNRTPPSRPNSRGAGTYLNPHAGLLNSNSATTLSAKEQMHVARATGTPLISMASNGKDRNDPTQPGLMGVLSARERERDNLKQGIRGAAVQQAIAARQQEQLRMEQEAQAQWAQQQAQAQQYQQMAYQQAMMGQQQQMQMAAMGYQPQQQMQPQQQQQFNRQSMYGAQPMYGGQSMAGGQSMYGGQQSRPQSMQFPSGYHVNQAASQMGGYGGQYVQQQQQQAYQQAGYQGQPQSQWQQGRR